MGHCKQRMIKVVKNKGFSLDRVAHLLRGYVYTFYRFSVDLLQNRLMKNKLCSEKVLWCDIFWFDFKKKIIIFVNITKNM